MAMGNKLVTHQAAVGQCPHPGWHMALTAWPLALGHRLGSSCSAGGALGCRFSQLVIAEESVHSSTCQLHCCVLVLTLKSSTFCIKVLFLGSGNEEQFLTSRKTPQKLKCPWCRLSWAESAQCAKSGVCLMLQMIRAVPFPSFVSSILIQTYWS